MPASSSDLPTNHTSKLFGIVYITLTRVMDTIVPAAGPWSWSWLGKSASYLLKLAPLLWWALPAKKLAQVTSGTGRPAAQEWVPDTLLLGRLGLIDWELRLDMDPTEVFDLPWDGCHIYTKYGWIYVAGLGCAEQG
ncbi:hypothetical protein DSO57_1022283 [Entomophthora muscae]|uniref:Uncharacterized protein n=1 Tax=Entomophthora muscae TaxID=34485 RepID=A0ACC2S5E6_9FUNG|nr:hypothetical protein DSO57_1022283 [Entomophthora muscae]